MGVKVVRYRRAVALLTLTLAALAAFVWAGRGIAEPEEGRVCDELQKAPLSQWFAIDKPYVATVKVPAKRVEGIYIQSDKVLGATGVYRVDNASRIKFRSGSANIIDPNVTGKLKAQEIDFGVIFYSQGYNQGNRFLGGTVLASLVSPASPLGSIGFTTVMQKEFEWDIDRLVTLPSRPAYFVWFVESDVRNLDTVAHNVQFTVDLTWQVYD